MIKRLIKRGLQTFAARFGRHTRDQKQAELVVLMYHRILPNDDPRARLEEPGMIVTPETFRLHMTCLQQICKPIHLSRWLKLKHNGESLPARSCAITFDDGWLDNYQYAYPILQQMDIPATIFLVSDMIGEKQSFWPERLSGLVSIIARDHSAHWALPDLDWIRAATTSYTFDDTVPDQEQLSEIIAAAKTLEDTEINHRLDQIEMKLGIASEPDEAALLDWEQVNEMCHSGIIEVGSHTCHHIRLNDDIDIQHLQDEVLNSKSTIEQHTGEPVTTFCYPNGDYSESALDLVMKNYSGAVTTENGWNTMHSNSHLLKRIALHEDISSDRTSFLARLSGWL